MKKILSTTLIGLLCLSMFSMFAPKAKADSAYLTDIVQLTTNPYDDRGAGWFLDSSKIAYSAFADSWYRNIWVMNSDGSNKKQLTFGNVVDDAPAYSPDGTKIVFMRYGLRGIDGSDLMMMNADGTNIQQLTSTGLHRGQPRWSHDGQRLAFYYGGAGTPTWEIHIMNADGTNEVTVVSSTSPESAMNPAWSPDDTKLVYTMDDGIWTVNTSPPYQTTHIFQTSLPTTYAVFSPDGKYIMYASGAYGQLQDLYLIDIYGNFIAQLTHDTKFGYIFDWSPDGQYIAYNSMSSGNYDVWRAKIVGAFSAGAMVGYWKFDEGSGNIAHDSSGNGNDGTLIDGPQWVTGVSGYALRFNGLGSYVSIPDSPSLTISGSQVSAELWFKPNVALDSSTAPACILDKGNNYGFVINMGQYPPATGEIAFVVAVGSPPWYWISTTTNHWTVGSWYHIAGTYDGAYLRVYVNGVLENSLALSGQLHTETFPLAIGSYCLGTTRPWLSFNGAIDEVKIYSYARTAEEIQSDYSSGIVSLPWRDDFNYNTKEEMKSAGWDLIGEHLIQVGGGAVSLTNDGVTGPGVRYVGKFPSGIFDFVAETSTRRLNTYLGGLGIDVYTEKHTYSCGADGWTSDYRLAREPEGVICAVGGYQPKQNEWETLRFERTGNVFRLYVDDELKLTYAEIDDAPSKVIGVGVHSGWIVTTQYDYISLATPTIPQPDFEISVSPTSRSVIIPESAEYEITVASINGFSSGVTLDVLITPLADIGWTLEPCLVTPPSDGEASATLRINTYSTTLDQTYEITVKGTSDGKEKYSLPVSLCVCFVRGVETVVTINGFTVEHDKKTNDLFTIQQNFVIPIEFQGTTPTHFYIVQNAIAVSGKPEKYNMAGVINIWEWKLGETEPEDSWSDWKYGDYAGSVVMRSTIRGATLKLENGFITFEFTLPPDSFIDPGASEILLVGPGKKTVGGAKSSVMNVKFLDPTSGHIDVYFLLSSNNWVNGKMERISYWQETLSKETSEGLTFYDANIAPEPLNVGDFNAKSPALNDKGFWIKPDPESSTVIPPEVSSHTTYPTLMAGLHCPANMSLYDSAGRHVGHNSFTGDFDAEIPDAIYHFGEDAQWIVVINPPNDAYSIVLIGTAIGDYMLTIEYITYEQTATQTFNGTISDQEIQGFSLVVSEASMTFYMNAAIDIDPNTLNLGSKGNWITAYIELYEGVNVGSINVSSILLDNSIPVDPTGPLTIGDYDGDGIQDLMVKFDRTAVQNHILFRSITAGSVTLTLTGKLDDGTEFSGSDTIKVLCPSQGGGKNGKSPT